MGNPTRTGLRSCSVWYFAPFCPALRCLLYLSDMRHISANAVFSLRDLNRQPAKVLEVVRKYGSVEIRTRSGEVFTVSPTLASSQVASLFPDFSARWKKLRELGHVPPTLAENEHTNRNISGEV